jgi:hypothetical protein
MKSYGTVASKKRRTLPKTISMKLVAPVGEQPDSSHERTVLVSP